MNIIIALAHPLSYGRCKTLIYFNMNHFNICPSCIHRNNCVLTAQKDKVWSCSEFDEDIPNICNSETMQKPEQHKKEILQLV